MCEGVFPDWSGSPWVFSSCIRTPICCGTALTICCACCCCCSVDNRLLEEDRSDPRLRRREWVPLPAPPSSICLGSRRSSPVTDSGGKLDFFRKGFFLDFLEAPAPLDVWGAAAMVVAILLCRRMRLLLLCSFLESTNAAGSAKVGLPRFRT